MTMVFKKMACWEIAKKYNLPHWDVLLPTGCDCVLESMLRIEGVKHEDGSSIDLVNKNVSYILMAAIPVFGLVAMVFRSAWRYKVLYHFVAPTLHDELNDWTRLLLVVIPSVYYIKVWRDLRAGCVREDAKDS